MSNIEIHLPTAAASSGRERIVLDGQDITNTIVGIGLTARVGEINRIALDLHLPEIVINGEARVEITPQQQALLLALGWTPPTKTA